MPSWFGKQDMTHYLECMRNQIVEDKSVPVRMRKSGGAANYRLGCSVQAHFAPE